jgi:hypothetical protein
VAKNKKQAKGDDQIYKDGAQRLQEDHDKMSSSDSGKKSKKK